MRWFFGSIAVLVVASLVVFRIWPVEATVYQVLAEQTERGAYPRDGGYTEVRAITAAPDVFLARMDEIALATPRTTRVAGSLAERMVTYETRSLVFGFPDYTTVAIIPEPGRIGDLVQINGRLRFGKFDLDVNAARVTDWFDQLDLLTVRP